MSHVVNATLLIIAKSNQPGLVPFHKPIKVKLNSINPFTTSINSFTTHTILSRLRWNQLPGLIDNHTLISVIAFCHLECLETCLKEVGLKPTIFVSRDKILLDFIMPLLARVFMG